ncbi:MAG: glyoxalase [Candidatus Marinimicrobia bacterium]|nr:glyoxalase [Candidatus Neomarinimicrobiota bacterium]
MNPMFILYVSNQEISTSFYKTVLSAEPVLHVPGMTEFKLSEQSSLGLMPYSGIQQLLSPHLDSADFDVSQAKAELYLQVKNANEYLSRAQEARAKLLSPLQDRDWGQRVGYCLDLDGHVIAFAEI